MPELDDEQTFKYISTNIAANMFGLGFAATPSGLNAMKRMKSLSKEKEGVATDSMVTFLVLNTAGVTIIPTSVLAIRQMYGSSNPADFVLLGIFSTFMACVAGLWLDRILKKKRMKNDIYLIFIDDSLLNFIYIFTGRHKKVKAYDIFAKGCKDGLNLFTEVFPSVIAMVMAVSLLKSCGILKDLAALLGRIFPSASLIADLTPMVIFRPISGSASIAALSSICASDADSLSCKIASTIQGSTDTTIYVLALYFSSVGITKWKHALPVGLFADFVGMSIAIILGLLFLDNSHFIHIMIK